MRQKKPRSEKIDISLPRRLSEAIIPDLIGAIQVGYGGFAQQYLLDELLSKFTGEDTDPADVRRDRAIEKWLGAEHRNEQTNARLMYASIVDWDFGWITYGSLVRRIRSVVRRVIGSVVPHETFMAYVHTNGASTRVGRSETAALRKLSGKAHVSYHALTHWIDILNADEANKLQNQEVILRGSSELFTVPKKSDIDRVACKEPEINMLMQRSCGQLIRKKLRLSGIDLNDQTVNQRLASVAYERGLATLDLSSASDTISSQLVQQLLPTAWWSLLDDLRVKFVTINNPPVYHRRYKDDDYLDEYVDCENDHGDRRCPGCKTCGTRAKHIVHELHMFSSMGNGFTFELESLLFYAITSVVTKACGFSPKTVSVYGDDIIAPSAVVPRLMRILSFFGFIPNRKKTHYRGKFRESCGKHYYAGFDVTPFYIRRPVTTLPDLIRLLNRVMEWDARGYGFMTTPSLAAFHWKYSRHVPRKFWGGVDPADVSCLVTGHAPRSRLVPITKDKKYSHTAALLHWMMQKEAQTVEAKPRTVIRKDREDGRIHAYVVCGEWEPIAIEPKAEIGFKAAKVSKGWYTSWRPWLIYHGPERK